MIRYYVIEIALLIEKVREMAISEAKIQVRYAETDMMGVVYHANYLIWMEVGRTKFVQDLGLDYKSMEAKGYVAPIIDVQVSYKHAVRYGEEVTVKTWIQQYSKLKTVYAYEMIKPDGKIACTGTSTHIVVNRETFRPVPLNRVDPEWHSVYENIMAQQNV